MKLKSLFLMVASAIAGIYLTSPEGQKAREVFRKKKSVFKPIIEDLLKQAEAILDGSKEINGGEIKANASMLIKSAQKQLLNIDLEKSLETIQEAIKVASAKIRAAAKESQSPTKAIGKKRS